MAGSTATELGQVVIGLTATTSNEGAISTGVYLAASIDSNVHAVFVEEDALHDLAGFSFAFAQRSGPSPPEKITPQAMIKAVERQAGFCREVLSKHAKRARLEWTFATRKGSLSTALHDEKRMHGDVLVLARAAAGSDPGELLANVRHAQRRSRAVVIAADNPSTIKSGPVVAVLETGHAGSLVIRLASRLAEKTGSALRILFTAGAEKLSNDTIAGLRSAVGSGQPVEILQLPHGSSQELITALLAMDPSLIIADPENSLMREDAPAQEILRAVNCPFLLIGDEILDASHERKTR